MPHAHPTRRSPIWLHAIVLSFVGLSASCESTPHGEVDMASGKCPVMHAAQDPAPINATKAAAAKHDWWPNQLDLSVLHYKNPSRDPMGADFDYAAAFKSLDLDAVKQDIAAVLTDSQDWWPADYGNYGPFMIRLAWHSAGTYRTIDGRGGSSAGTIRFAPLGSWPDNVLLDRARRLLWPVKKKYGAKLSWADLIVLSGNVALETMGFETFGFAGGREDVWGPEIDINWGPETKWLADMRHSGDRKLAAPFGATQMGLIYVNPEGPNGNPDPLAAARDIRNAFHRMAMSDEETVALIAGGHTVGKAHGAAPAAGNVGAEPESAPLEQQGIGWKNAYGTGKGKDAIGSGLEGAWTSTPVKWSQEYFENLFGYEWELGKGPGGGHQWYAKNAEKTIPDAHVEGKKHLPMMFTTDLALREDPGFRKISKRFHENPEEFNKAFARAWYKLTHRDMGPVNLLLGKEVAPVQLWQDPLPQADYQMVSSSDVDSLKQKILASGLSTAQLVRAAWASAASFRGSDKRGGANGARVRLAPQKDWQVNNPADLQKVLGTLTKIQGEFNAQSGDKKVSLADLIVLGGCAAVEAAAKQGGVEVEVPFHPGRTDASAAMTDSASFEDMEPAADGFRNYNGGRYDNPAPELLINRAQLLTLSAPEMTVLVGGLRVLGANYDGSKHGVFTTRPGTLSNDFFVNLLDMGTRWEKTGKDVYRGRDRDSGATKWTGTSVDLVFGANSQLRALAEVYACDDAGEKFVHDFVKAWSKVMHLDRFDLPAAARNGS